MKIVRKIMAQAPQRRRRMWKYVSPERRRLGLLVLALLLALLYAAWYFTNPTYIRRAAKKSLESLTGADVDVDRASFSLFEGIRLYNVRVRIRGDERPFFTAQQVVLKHRPGALLLRRRIEPTDIVCLRPVVNLEYEDEASNAERLFRLASAQQRGMEARRPLLPRVTLKDGLLRSRVRSEGQDSPPVEEPFDAVLTPLDDRTYQITVQGPRKGRGNVEWARLELDVETGKIRPVEGSASENSLRYLPPKYRQWIRRYQLAGDFSLIEGAGTNTEKKLYEVELDDFSMKLPEPEGGLTLTGVSGRLLFDPQGVRIRDIQGQVKEAGLAAFTLNGYYKGYGKTSPFDVKIDIRGVRLPERISGPLAKHVETIRREFAPKGKIDLSLDFRRDVDGRNTFSGVIRPRNIRMVFRRFPLPLRRVGGEVWFTETGVHTVALTARRGAGRIDIAGTLNRQEGSTLYDIVVTVRDGQFEPALGDALPEKYRSIWQALSPGGRGDMKVHVVKARPEESMTIELDVQADGQAEVTYNQFPYPLKNLSGEVSFRGDVVTIPWAEARDGSARARIRGRVGGVIGRDWDVELHVSAERVPLDEKLLNALRDRPKRLLEDLAPVGQASRVEAVVRKKGDQPVDYRVAATLQDAGFCYKRFPYVVESAAGNVTITPDKVTIADVRGRHGQAGIRVDGTILLDAQTEDPAYDLHLLGEAMPLDKEFHQALPPKVREVWDSLQPTGQADMDLTLRSPKEPGGSLDFDLTIDAQGGTIRYRDFPYTFRGVTGKAHVTPGHVRLLDMKARDGKMSAALSGDIRYFDDGRQDVIFRVAAENLQIDKNLLAAIPLEIIPLAKRLQAGGRVNADLTEFRLRRTPLPASQPTTRPMSKIVWQTTGSLGFRDVTLDAGFGPRTLTGSITGTAGQDGEGLAVEADLRLESLTIRQHRLTDIQARLSKEPGGRVLHFGQIVGKALGGKFSGEATVRLSDPIHYEFSTSLTNIDLDKLVNAGQTDPRKRVKVSGRLEGRLSLEAIGGTNSIRQAEGELVISKGELFQLPVVLGLLNVVYLQLPGETAFNRGFMRYHLKKDRLRLMEIYLTGWDPQLNTGRGISVLGSGTVNMKTGELKLTFLTGPPGEMPRLDEITEDILQGLSRSLMEVRVGGTLQKPEMTPVPLSPVETILRRLLEPSLKTE